MRRARAFDVNLEARRRLFGFARVVFDRGRRLGGIFEQGARHQDQLGLVIVDVLRADLEEAVVPREFVGDFPLLIVLLVGLAGHDGVHARREDRDRLRVVQRVAAELFREQFAGVVRVFFLEVAVVVRLAAELLGHRRAGVVAEGLPSPVAGSGVGHGRGELLVLPAHDADLHVDALVVHPFAEAEDIEREFDGHAVAFGAQQRARHAVERPDGPLAAPRVAGDVFAVVEFAAGVDPFDLAAPRFERQLAALGHAGFESLRPGPFRNVLRVDGRFDQQPVGDRQKQDGEGRQSPVTEESPQKDFEAFDRLGHDGVDVLILHIAREGERHEPGRRHEHDQLQEAGHDLDAQAEFVGRFAREEPGDREEDRDKHQQHDDDDPPAVDFEYGELGQGENPPPTQLHDALGEGRARGDHREQPAEHQGEIDRLLREDRRLVLCKPGRVADRGVLRLRPHQQREVAGVAEQRRDRREQHEARDVQPLFGRRGLGAQDRVQQVNAQAGEDESARFAEPRLEQAGEIGERERIAVQNQQTEQRISHGRGSRGQL